MVAAGGACGEGRMGGAGQPSLWCRRRCHATGEASGVPPSFPKAPRYRPRSTAPNRRRTAARSLPGTGRLLERLRALLQLPAPQRPRQLPQLSNGVDNVDRDRGARDEGYAFLVFDA
jgi:hypothetical protein